MKEHPILFSTKMVRAILDGVKTQTRRPNPCGDASGKCPYAIGDRLWVRETWNHENYPYPYRDGTHVFYRADFWDDPHGLDGEKSTEGKYRRWLPSIHMPRSASRLMLVVTGIRHEPLLAISDKDAIKEGMYRAVKSFPALPYPLAKCWDGEEKVLYPDTARDDFSMEWRSIYPSGPRSWDADANVWVIDFELLPFKPEQEIG